MVMEVISNMKRFVKILTGILICAGVTLAFKVSVAAKETVNVSSFRESKICESGYSLYNDTDKDLWMTYSENMWSNPMSMTYGIYLTDEHGGTKVGPGKYHPNSSAIRCRLVLVTNEAQGSSVIFKYGNGQDDEKKYVLLGECVERPADPEWNGYVFKGWFIDSDYSEEFDFNTTIEQEYTLYAKWVEAGSGKVVPFREYSSYIDRDTYKSEMPSRTILVSDNSNDTRYMDMKIHATDETNKINQKFLAGQLAGKNANELITKDVYPRRDLSITENGDRRELIWNNLDINTAGIVSAVVYNQTDGAYVIYGISDGKGCVKFNDFILRPASTITVLKNN